MKKGISARTIHFLELVCDSNKKQPVSEHHLSKFESGYMKGSFMIIRSRVYMAEGMRLGMIKGIAFYRRSSGSKFQRGSLQASREIKRKTILPYLGREEMDTPKLLTTTKKGRSYYDSPHAGEVQEDLEPCIIGRWGYRCKFVLEVL
jgi:hypothetical protein